MRPRITSEAVLLEYFRGETVKNIRAKIQKTKDMFPKDMLPILNEAPDSYFLEPERWNNYGAEEWKDNEQTY